MPVMAPRKHDLTDDLRRAVRESGRSLLSLAKETGLPYATVHNFARGRTDVYLASAGKLATALGLRLSKER